MSGRHFLDSNVCIYLFDEDRHKSSTAESLFTESAVVSTQVLAETANVLRRKFKFAAADIAETARFISNRVEVRSMTPAVFDLALQVFTRYGFSLYDSMVVASALEAACDVLYSEDLQHGQRILHPDDRHGGSLQVLNPFT